MNSTNKKRPVPSRGRGRPALELGAEAVPVTIRMTSTQKEKLARLGGAPWVRERIDKAREPT
jgi:hypothetical protein